MTAMKDIELKTMRGHLLYGFAQDHTLEFSRGTVRYYLNSVDGLPSDADRAENLLDRVLDYLTAKGYLFAKEIKIRDGQYSKKYKITQKGLDYVNGVILDPEILLAQ